MFCWVSAAAGMALCFKSSKTLSYYIFPVLAWRSENIPKVRSWEICVKNNRTTTRPVGIMAKSDRSCPVRALEWHYLMRLGCQIFATRRTDSQMPTTNGNRASLINVVTCHTTAGWSGTKRHVANKIASICLDLEGAESWRSHSSEASSGGSDSFEARLFRA